MSELKCIIVEDEPLAVKVLSDYISQVPFLKLQETFRDAILASDFLRNNDVDLIFLDIHLPKLRGMAFLKTLAHPPAVIITTAYHQYALEGYDMNVTDYLLKPFEFERFLKAVSKVKGSEPENQKSETTGNKKEFIFLNVHKKRVKVMFEEILYIESQQEYIKIITVRNNYVLKMSTHEIESLLPASLFRRVHRSFIVSVGKIESYTADTIEINGVTIPIGRGYKDVMKSINF